MFYIYLFIFCKNKYFDIHHHCSVRNINSNSNSDISPKVLLNNNNNSFLKNLSSELTDTKTYVLKDGYDIRFNITDEINDLFYLLVYNQKKLAILNSLLSNSTSIPHKLELVDRLDEFQEESKYKPETKTSKLKQQQQLCDKLLGEITGEFLN
jgi:hypothetical protein